MILLNAKAMQGEWGNILTSYHFPLVPHFELKTFVKKKWKYFCKYIEKQTWKYAKKDIQKYIKKEIQKYFVRL